VAEQVADVLETDAVLDQVGGEAMPQDVGRDLLGDAGALPG